MKKKIFLALGALIFLTAFDGSKFQMVDPRPCIAVAERYYSALAVKNKEKVSTFYSQEFLSKHEDKWRDLLVGLNMKFGPVTEAKLMEAKVVPIDRVGCSLLSYEVHRGSFITKENLILKPSAGNSAVIIGHEILRLDTGQKISAGITVTEKKILSFP